MKFDITQRMAVVDQAIDATTNSLHKAILKNYRRHAHLEVSGRWEEILTPEMTDPDAEYRITVGNDLIVARGMDQVREIYKGMVDTRSSVIYHTDEYIMVSDDGLMTQYVSHRYWPGDQLAAFEKSSEYDPEKHYVIRQTIMNFFTYNKDAVLTGEIVYFAAGREVEVCPPEDLITVEEARERLAPLIEPIAHP